MAQLEENGGCVRAQTLSSCINATPLSKHLPVRTEPIPPCEVSELAGRSMNAIDCLIVLEIDEGK